MSQVLQWLRVQRSLVMVVVIALIFIAAVALSMVMGDGDGSSEHTTGLSIQLELESQSSPAAADQVSPAPNDPPPASQSAGVQDDRSSGLPQVLADDGAEAEPSLDDLFADWLNARLADEEAEAEEVALRPIEDYPVLTWEDRVDMEGQPAPRIQRGRHERRIFDTHVDRALSRDNPDPVRPFGHAIAARGGSPIAHDRYAKSAVEVGISHRLFHQASRGERHRMAVPLAETVEVMVDLGKIVDRGPHTFSFIGTVEEHEDSAVHLVYNEGTVSGTVALYGN
ncbi:MAG: hypothetical protein EA401_09570, partial [Planctomycetota bacterium]